jgi:NAD(P)H-hydrate repair Nnr-like enzyme with NAD(P)H-hydrate dehydratase domain
MAARAGSASGAGTVTVMCRDDAWQAVASSLSAQMAGLCQQVPGRKFSAVLAGPGWGLDSASTEVLAGLLDSALPLVLDADACACWHLIMAAKRQSGTPLVLTPHPGEFAGLRTPGNRQGNQHESISTVIHRPCRKPWWRPLPESSRPWNVPCLTHRQSCNTVQLSTMRWWCLKTMLPG